MKIIEITFDGIGSHFYTKEKFLNLLSSGEYFQVLGVVDSEEIFGNFPYSVSVESQMES